MKCLRLIPLIATGSMLGAYLPARAGDVQPWPTAFASLPAGGGWQISGEVIGRFAHDANRASQGEYRLEAGHPVAPGVIVWAGYVHVDSILDGHISRRENQAVEQLNWSGFPLGPVRLLFRTRLEQRFLSGSDAVAWRIRQQVRAVVPLGHVSLVAWVEPFIALNRTAIVRTRFDQVRYFGGVSIPIGHHVDVETGLLRQEIHGLQGDIANTALPLILNVRI